MSRRKMVARGVGMALSIMVLLVLIALVSVLILAGPVITVLGVMEGITGAVVGGVIITLCFTLPSVAYLCDSSGEWVPR